MWHSLQFLQQCLVLVSLWRVSIKAYIFQVLQNHRTGGRIDYFIMQLLVIQEENNVRMVKLVVIEQFFGQRCFVDVDGTCMAEKLEFWLWLGLITGDWLFLVLWMMFLRSYLGVHF